MNRARLWTFFVILLAVKPFIDLMWNLELFQVAGLVMSPTRLVGLVVFGAAAFGSLVLPRVRPVAEMWIWLFLALHTLVALTAYTAGNVSLTEVADILLRAFDAYLIYFVFSRLWTCRRDTEVIAKTIWLSILAVNIVSLATWATGDYAVSTTAGIDRFAGLYNDAGSPAYNAVMSLVFAVFSLETVRLQNRTPGILLRGACLVTAAVSCTLLGLTLTRSAAAILGLFVLLWWGVYRKRLLIALPLIPAIAFLVYNGNDSVRQRVSNEMVVFVDGDYSETAVNSLGTGRIAVWKKLIAAYGEFPLALQLFGTARTYGAHNQFLAYLLQIGALGLFVFLGLLYTWNKRLLHEFRTTRRPEPIFAFTLLAMFSVLGLTGHPFGWTTLYWYVVIMLSTTNARFRARKQPRLVSQRRRRRPVLRVPPRSRRLVFET